VLVLRVRRRAVGIVEVILHRLAVGLGGGWGEWLRRGVHVAAAAAAAAAAVGVGVVVGRGGVVVVVVVVVLVAHRWLMAGVDRKSI
jgi:hypothetical protein